MKKYSLTLSIVMLIVLSFCLQCSKYEPTPKQIVDCFKKDEKGAVSIKPKNLVKIYIDGSYSMAGFVRPEGNTVFGQMLEKLRSMTLPGYTKEFYKFAGEIEQIQDKDVHTAHYQRWFFGGSDTKLSDVSDMFLKCPPNSLPSAFVVVTDGVPSVPGEASDYVKVSNKVNQWLLKKYVFQILAMRSQFNGEICSETNKQKGVGSYKFPYSSVEKEIKTYRPFYLYIFAPDRDCVEEIVSQIKPNKISPDYQFIDFSSRIFKEYSVEFETEEANPIPGRENPLVHYTEPLEFSNMTELSWKKKTSGKTSSPGYLRVTLDFQLSRWMRAFVRHPENIRLESECVSFPKKDSCSPVIPTPTVYLDSASVEQGTGEKIKVTLLLRFKDELPPGRWFAYHIRFLPYREAFELAPWVEEWSTDRDDEQRLASKTLNFGKFISCLLEQPSLTDQSIGEIYIGIRR
jgi:hypothetical protein